MQIKKIIVHCTATSEGKNFTSKDVKSWHLQKGYSDIGYHYLLLLSGEIEKGRAENIEGAHCAGHNSDSLGVCYIGGLSADNKPKDTMTDKQKNSLIKLLKELKSRYPNATIHGHNEFSNKACPCFDVKKWTKENNI